VAGGTWEEVLHLRIGWMSASHYFGSAGFSFGSAGFSQVCRINHATNCVSSDFFHFNPAYCLISITQILIIFNPPAL
jgi:hypothetical protein